MRHAATIVVLAVILAISLAPAVVLRFFPSETSEYLLAPVWNAIGSRIGFPAESIASVWIVTSFVLATVTASALLVVLARELTRSVRRGG